MVGVVSDSSLEFNGWSGDNWGMKKLIKYIFVLGFILLSSGHLQARVVGKVAALKGQVQVMRKGQWAPLKLKDELRNDDQLKTGDQSLLLVFLNNGSTHKLGENTQLKLHDEADPTVLEIVSGSLFSLFKSKTQKNGKKKHYRIKTQSVVAGVRGTQFFTSYGRSDKDDDNWLCVNEGVVEVKKIGETKATLVKAGEGIRVDAKGVSAPKPLPWTKKLNWSMKPSEDLENRVNIEEAYTDLLDKDYD